MHDAFEFMCARWEWFVSATIIHAWVNWCIPAHSALATLRSWMVTQKLPAVVGPCLHEVRSDPQTSRLTVHEILRVTVGSNIRP